MSAGFPYVLLGVPSIGLLFWAAFAQDYGAMMLQSCPNGYQPPPRIYDQCDKYSTGINVSTTLGCISEQLAYYVVSPDASSSSGSTSSPRNLSGVASVDACCSACSTNNCNLWIWCGNPTGCCDLQGGCQLGSLTGMSPFGTCLLQYDATLGPSNARNAPGVNYRYQPSDVLNWTDDATKCKSFTSGIYLDRFKTPPLNVTGYTALQGSNAGRAYNLRCTDSVTSDNTFPCSYYGLAESASNCSSNPACSGFVFDDLGVEARNLQPNVSFLKGLPPATFCTYLSPYSSLYLKDSSQSALAPATASDQIPSAGDLSGSQPGKYIGIGVAVGVVGAMLLAAAAYAIWRIGPGKGPRRAGLPTIAGLKLQGGIGRQQASLSSTDEKGSSYSQVDMYSDHTVSSTATRGDNLASFLAEAAEHSGSLAQSAGTRRVAGGLDNIAAHHSLSQVLERSSLQFDWRIEPERIQICRRPNGSLERLGEGGFGTVYKAKLDGFNEVAVKVLAAEAASPEENMRRLCEEIDIMRACRDPHIVLFIGAWAHKDTMYLVTELCQHGDLFTALGDERMAAQLSWYNRGRDVALAVAHGLYYLHSHAIVHLDIKSPNVLLDKELRAKIADVGLARTLFAKTHLSHAMAGTFHWQAPECLLGLQASFPADIFSSGVILWELITGEQPVRGAYREPRVPEECPAAIAELVNDCMRPDPRQRPNARKVVMRIRDACNRSD